MPYFTRLAVVPGTPQIIGLSNVPAPITITTQPGASGTMLVEYSSSPAATSAPNDTAQTLWQSWPAGSVAVSKTDGLLTPITAIRVTSLVATGYVEVVGSN